MIPKFWRWQQNTNECWFHMTSGRCRLTSGHRGAGKRSSGVFLIPQSLDVGSAIDELILIWLASEAADWDNRLEWLPLWGHCASACLIAPQCRGGINLGGAADGNKAGCESGETQN